MLVQVSALSPESPEEVDMNVSLLSESAHQDPASPWSGQPLQLRGLFRDGTGFTLGLSLTECAQLYLMLHGDANVRGWAELVAARAFGDLDRAFSKH